VENKPEILLVSLGKPPNGMPLPMSGWTACLEDRKCHFSVSSLSWSWYFDK